MPSNHLWFLLLSFFFFLKKLPFLVVWCRASWDAMIYLLCLTAVLIAWGALSQQLRHNCCFAHRGFDTLCLTDIQSVGTVVSLSLSLSLAFSLLLDFFFPFCPIFLFEAKLLSKQEDLLLYEHAPSCRTVSKVPAWLNWFHLLHGFSSRKSVDYLKCN